MQSRENWIILGCGEKSDCFAKHQPGMAGLDWLWLGRTFLATRHQLFCSTLYSCSYETNAKHPCPLVEIARGSNVGGLSALMSPNKTVQIQFVHSLLTFVSLSPAICTSCAPTDHQMSDSAFNVAAAAPATGMTGRFLPFLHRPLPPPPPSLLLPKFGIAARSFVQQT